MPPPLPLAALFVSVSIMAYLVIRVSSTGYSSYTDRAVKAINAQLSENFLFVMDPQRFYVLNLLATGFGFIAGFAIADDSLASQLSAAMALAAAGFCLPRIILRILAARRLERLNRQLPEGLDLLVNSMRAGLTLYQAMQRAIAKVPKPLAAEFGVIHQELRLGSGLRDALRHWAVRNNLVDVKLVVISADIALRYGGNVTEVFDNVSRLIRSRYMFYRELRSLTGEGRLQAVVLAILPFLLLILLTIINRQSMVPFLMSGLGQCIVCIVFVMQVISYVWIKNILNIEY